jgi:tail tape-measure protein
MSNESDFVVKFSAKEADLLKAIEAIQKGGASIGKSFENADKDTQKAINSITREVNKISKALEKVKSNALTGDSLGFGKLTGAATVGAAAGTLIANSIGTVTNAVKNFIVSGVQYADMIADTSIELGVSAGAIQSWAYAAAGANTDMSTLTRTVEKMQVNLVKASEGSKESAEAFNKLGVSAKALLGADTETQFTTIIDKLKEIKDPAERAKAGIEIFGKSYNQMRQLVDGGSESLDAARAKLTELGLLVSDLELGKAADVKDKYAQLTEELGLLQTKVASELAPAFMDLANFIEGEMPGAIKVFESALNFTIYASIAAVQELMSTVYALKAAWDIAANAARLAVKYSAAGLVARQFSEEVRTAMDTPVGDAEGSWNQSADLSRKSAENMAKAFEGVQTPAGPPRPALVPPKRAGGYGGTNVIGDGGAKKAAGDADKAAKAVAHAAEKRQDAIDKIDAEFNAQTALSDAMVKSQEDYDALKNSQAAMTAVKSAGIAVDDVEYQNLLDKAAATLDLAQAMKMLTVIREEEGKIGDQDFLLESIQQSTDLYQENKDAVEATNYARSQGAIKGSADEKELIQLKLTEIQATRELNSALASSERDQELDDVRAINEALGESYAKYQDVIRAIKLEREARSLGKMGDEIPQFVNQNMDKQRGIDEANESRSRLEQTAKDNRPVGEILNDYMGSQGMTNQSMFDMFTSQVDGAAASITQLATTGKTDMAGLAQSMIASITQIIIKMLILKAISMAMGMFGGGAGVAAGAVGTGATATMGGGLGMSGAEGFAKGGAFGNMGNVIPFAKGGIFNSPHLFKFAGGAGMMGEAGPEAIMPLSRGSDGKLGVRGGGGGTVNNIAVNQTINPAPSMGPDETKKFAEQMNKGLEAKIMETMAKAQRQSGAGDTGPSRRVIG